MLRARKLGTAGDRQNPQQAAAAVPTPLVATVMPMQALPLDSMSQVPGEMESGRPEGDGSTLLSGIFRVDFDRLITEEVKCAGKPIKALIDTGAAISVISPKTVLELDLAVKPWNGPGVLMANGQRGSPLGAVDIELETTRGRVEGKILMMQMDEVQLLLGMDLLSQHGRIVIDFPTEGPARLLSELPVGAVITEQEGPEILIAVQDTLIPPRTQKAIRVYGMEAGWTNKDKLLIPSPSLKEGKGLSTGYAILPGDLIQKVFVTNLSPDPVWLPMGAVVCQVEDADEVLSVDEGYLTDEEAVDTTPRPPVTREWNYSEQVTRDALRARLGKGLTLEEQEAALDVLTKHSDCFATNDMDLGQCPWIQHRIDTGDAAPISQIPYKSAFKERELIQAQVDRMTKQGIIEESQSPWSSPVVLAKKPDGTWRFCVDYRKLNAVTVDDVYPLPNIEDALQRLEGSSLFSLMDLQSGYHQLALHKDDQKKSAFITADGLYQFKVLPFGLKGAPSRFQRTMDIVLAGLRWTSCLVYIDDVVVWGRDCLEHLTRLDKVLTCLKKAGLKLKLTKCHFLEGELKILGHIVNKEGVAPNPEKIKAVAEFPSPRPEGKRAENVKLIQSFVGLCSYYRRHIQDFSKIARPLTELTKKDSEFIWMSEQKESFQQLKDALANAALLNHPRKDLPMEIYPDACGHGLGATLSQRIDGVEKPLCFASRLVSKTEANYSITELECLALVWALKKFRSYIWGCKVIVYTDHSALCWLMTKRDLAGRLARWKLSIQEYDITIKYRSGKLHINGDSLSRFPVDKPEAEEEEDPCLQISHVMEEKIRDPFTGETPDNEDDWIDARYNAVAKAQAQEPHWKDLIERLKEKDRKSCKNYVLINELLYLRKFTKDRVLYRLCVPQYLKRKILRAHHDDLIAGHMGMTRTRQRIMTRYHWPKMATEINQYVQSCVSCQARKGPPQKPGGFLQSIHVEKPFQKVGIDLLGPFPLSKGGKRNIIVQ